MDTDREFTRCRCFSSESARREFRVADHDAFGNNADNDSGLSDRLLELLTGSFWRPVVAASMPLAIYSDWSHNASTRI